MVFRTSVFSRGSGLLSYLSADVRAVLMTSSHSEGPVTVNGFGVIDGRAMMQAFKFHGQSV